MQVLSDINTNNTKANIILDKDNNGGSICLYGTSDMISGDTRNKNLLGKIVFANSFNENGEPIWYEIPSVNDLHIVSVDVPVNIDINIETDSEKRPGFDV